MKKFSPFLFLLLFVCTTVVSAQNSPAPAQQTAPRATVVSAKRANAVRVTQPPVLDGMLNDDVWKQITPATDFIQNEPVEGQPSSEKTEVRVAYDDRMIYIGVMAFDSDPSGIVATDTKRDSSLGGQDSFQLIFDTYHDKQNGYIFGTTPAGNQYDAQVRNEGETLRGGPPTGGTGGNSGGAGAGINTNWDGSWEVKTHVGTDGWSAEFAIPLRTLRYGSAPQTWGINFARGIERKRETTFWSPVARIYSLSRLSSAGELRGLNVPAPRDFKLMPYVSGSTNNTFPSRTRKTVNDGDFGIDAKLGVTSSTTLDLTYNTDFAQVEVDEQQINLTRFNLNFPEKRPFFLENRGLFAVGRPGEIDLFFSRAIGISSDGNGTLLPIVGGARLTGKASGMNVGLLNMQTEETVDSRGNVLNANNFTAVRVNKDLPNRSNFGVIAVNRQGTGDAAGDDNWNRTWGADGRWGIGEAISLSGFVARTETPGADDRERAFSGAFEYRSRLYETQVSYAEVGDDFDPQVGFLEREDGYRQSSMTLRRHVRTPGLTSKGVREWEPHASYESYWGFDGVQETATLHVDSRLDFENGYTLGSTALNVQWEGLREPFQVYSKGSKKVIVPAGDYRSPYFLTMGNTDRRKWISAGMAANIGGFLSGSQLSLTPSLNIRKEGLITSTLRWAHNDIDLPQGKFVTNLITGRVTYNLSTQMNISSLLQYNDLTDRWSSNIRFTWLRTAATGLYLVYNDTEQFNGIGPLNRSFIVKYSHQIDVLD